MHAARIRPGPVEKADALRVFRRRNVEQFEAGRLQSGLRGLIGDGKDVAHRFERIGAHLRMRQVGARDDLQLARVADIDRSEILRRAFMREPQDAAAVLRELHRHAFAHAAEPLERIMPEQFEIPGQRTVICPSALGHSSLPSAGSCEIVAAPARQSPCRTKLPFLRHPGLGRDDDSLRLLRSWARRLFRALLARRTRGLGRGERQRRGREAGGRGRAARGCRPSDHIEIVAGHGSDLLWEAAPSQADIRQNEDRKYESRLRMGRLRLKR